jgi:hypothetical protein
MGNCCCSCKKYSKHIRFNVGGKIFDTTLGTVTRRGKDKSNLLALMVTSRRRYCRKRVKQLRTTSSDTHTFIDRDGKHFRHILNWLRDPDGELPELDAATYKELLKEAEYYRLPELAKAIFETLHPHTVYVEK